VRSLLHLTAIAMTLAACAPAAGFGDDTQPQDDADTTDVATPDDAAPTPDASPTNDAGTPPTTAVQIIVEPNGNGGQEVVDAINAAKKSVHMTMYLLTSTDVIDALIARHKAGVDVKVLLDSSSTTGNGSVYNQLKSAGVSVAWSSTTFTYTHEKCVIVDGKTAWIMTMNLTYSSPTSNREYLAIDTAAADVAEAEAIFAGDFADKPPSSVTGSLVVAPINALATLTGLIGQAKSTVDIEAEELSDYHTADALKAALGRGVKVRVVLAKTTLTSSGQAAVTEIKGAGGKLVTLATPYVHAKAMVVDGATAYVGSENFSTGSLSYNRELGVVFTTGSEVQKVATTISGDFAKGTSL
jgi:cardiolipin synthase